MQVKRPLFAAFHFPAAVWNQGSTEKRANHDNHQGKRKIKQRQARLKDPDRLQ